MLYEELLQIQKMLEGNEYTDGGVSYYIEIDRLDSSVPMSVALKWKLAALRVAPSSEIELNIEKIEAPTEEMKRLSEEWHFDEEISGRMLGLLANNEEMYRFCNDYKYISRGNVGEIFRVIKRGGEMVLIGFYIAD